MQRYEYERTEAGAVKVGHLTHRSERAIPAWTLDDLKGLMIRLRDIASGGQLAAGEEVFVEMRRTSGGTLISVGVRAATVRVQLPEHLSQAIVYAWHKLQPGAMFVQRSPDGSSA